MKKSCFLLLIFASFSVNAQIGLTYGLKVSSNYNPNPDLPNRLGLFLFPEKGLHLRK